MKIMEDFYITRCGDCLVVEGTDGFNPHRGIVFQEYLGEEEADKLHRYLTRWLNARRNKKKKEAR